MVVHQLMEAYGASLKDVMSMTLPQIILLSHASYVTSEVVDRKAKANSAQEQNKTKKDSGDPIVFRGKRVSELTDDELLIYYGGGFC